MVSGEDYGAQLRVFDLEIDGNSDNDNVKW